MRGVGDGMEFDYSKLRGRIVEKFHSQRGFAKAIGTSEKTLSNKMNSIIFFRQDDIVRICGLLGIPTSEISDYFFTEQKGKCT